MIHKDTHMVGDIIWTRDGWMTIDIARNSKVPTQYLRPTTRYELQRNGLIHVAQGTPRPNEAVHGTYVDVVADR